MLSKTAAGAGDVVSLDRERGFPSALLATIMASASWQISSTSVLSAHTIAPVQVVWRVRRQAHFNIKLGAVV